MTEVVCLRTFNWVVNDCNFTERRKTFKALLLVVSIFSFHLEYLRKKSASPIICEREESVVLTDPVSGLNKRPNCLCMPRPEIPLERAETISPATAESKVMCRPDF